VPAASSSQRPSKARPLAGCPLAAPPQATTPLHRSGLRPTRVAAWPLRYPAVRPWGASRASPAPGLLGPLLTAARWSGGDYSTLSPPPGHPADLPRSAVIPSVHRRRIDQVRPSGGWRTLWSRAHSSPAYHTSYPVRVPRPAHSFHASFRPPHGDALALPLSFGSTHTWTGDFHPQA
jgi:hypothetical protein